MIYYFYDTCSLLLKGDQLFKDPKGQIVISSITLQELEDIKTASNKDNEIKYQARVLLRELTEHKNEYECYIFRPDMMAAIEAKGLSETNDTRILACAIDYDTQRHPDETVFVTNDIALQNIANLFFGSDSIISVTQSDIADEYTGFLKVYLTDDEIADFYTCPTENKWNLLINQYIVIFNTQGEYIDSARWTENGFVHLVFSSFKSDWFGTIKPLRGDIYQQLLFDSLVNNQITMIRGPAGSGKTLISLGYLMYKLEKHEIDKIIVFCNTVATKGSAKLGYYPGSRDEKLLDSQIGNLLSSKLGDKEGVQMLIESNKLILLPCSDIRGYDTSGMKAGIYISEAQNMDIDLMKLVLQRVGEDSICIIDGDSKTQVDDINFAGDRNGMRRASQIFKGHNVYGEITLQNIYRSKIAEIAENM